jgi:ribosomal protein S18 acetylase RimI-like enzyme
MQFSDSLEFGHDDRKEVYEHVERYGSVDYEETCDALGMDPAAFGHHVAILKRDGILAREGDTLRIAFEAGTQERFAEGDVEFVIRPAREDDLTGLVGAMRGALSGRSDIVAESVADIVDHERVLLRYNEIESRVFFVATVNGDVVGWVHLSAPEVEKLSHTAELTVGVLEEYRGEGIGSQLLQRGLEWAKQNGFEKVYNSVPSTNERAIDWLTERGWETEAVREKHYRIDDDYVDEVMMAVWP